MKPRIAPRPAGQYGFTLLEAIVALVIFSLGSFALYGWLSTNLITLQRVEAGRERVALVTTALEVVRGVNPMEQAQGRVELGDGAVAWEAELVRPAEPGRTQVGQPSLFEIGLYQVHVTASGAGGDVVEFEVRQVGYRQVRSLERL